MSRKKSPDLLVPIVLGFGILFSVILGLQYQHSLKERELSADELIFLGNEALAPILYKERDTAKGVVADLARELSHKMGISIRVELMNWEEAQDVFLGGYGDALLQLNKTEDREKVFEFSSPLLESEFALFVRYGDRRIRGIEDLGGKIVGVESMGYASSLIQDVENVKIMGLSDMTHGFQSLEDGVFDAILIDQWIGAYELAKSRAGGISILREPVAAVTSHIAVRKGDTDLLARINESLKEMEQDGSMQRILYNWQGKKVVYITEDQYKNLILQGVVLVLCILFIAALYSLNRFRILSHQLQEDVSKRTRDLEEAKKKLEEVNEELYKQSILDPLTQIPNRRYFEEVFQRLFEESRKDETPLSVIVLDIDDFKGFNDRYGHLLGDRCLVETGRLIYKIAKETGCFAARYGGEEFVLLVKGHMEKAKIIAERLRLGVSALEIDVEEDRVLNTMSIGIAEDYARFQRKEDLFHAADQALYKAKSQGKNRIVC